MTTPNEQAGTLGLLGVPVLVSAYAPEDKILLVGKRKRPYSPIPRHIQDELLNIDRFNIWNNYELMGIIDLSGKEDSWISKRHDIQQIRGREEAIEKLLSSIKKAERSSEHDASQGASSS